MADTQPAVQFSVFNTKEAAALDFAIALALDMLAEAIPDLRSRPIADEQEYAGWLEGVAKNLESARQKLDGE